jgi:hypothetical protein
MIKFIYKFKYVKKAELKTKLNIIIFDFNITTLQSDIDFVNLSRRAFLFMKSKIHKNKKLKHVYSHT